MTPVRIAVQPPRPGEALVAVEACGLCGSDRLLRSGGFGSDRFPVIPGHEAAGTVVAVGAADEYDLKLVGERVALYYIDPDDDFFARSGKENLGPGVRRMGVDFDGALSQYVTRPIRSLVMGRGLPAAELAVLSDAVATPHHALKLAKVGAGQVVVVIGTGGIGSNAVQLAALRGATTIAVGRSEEKLAIANELGATAVLSSDVGAAEIHRAAGGQIDVVLQCVGSPQLDQLAVELAGNGATVVFVGASGAEFSLTSMSLIQRELTLLGSRGFTRQDIAEVIDMRISGKLRLDHLLSDVRPLSDAGNAFNTVGEDGRLRTIIEPWNGYESLEATVNGDAA